jgi:hypothetical protein
MSYESMELSADGGVTLNVCTAEAGSASHHAPDRLASWTATLADDETTARASEEARRA